MTAKHLIKLRTKELSDGRQTLYLDYEKGGKRVREALRLYLEPETTRRAIAANKRTMKQAQAMLAEREKELDYYNHGIEEEPQSGITLLQAVDSYVEKLKAEGSKDRHAIVTVRRAIVELVVTDMLLSDVDKDFCIRLMECLKTDFKAQYGRPLTKNSAHAMTILFSSSLNFAVENGWLRKNPMRFLRISDYVPRDRVEKVFLTSDELKQLMATQCPVISRPQVKQAFLFACLTGLSYSDVISLMWKEIKTVDGVTTIPMKSKGTRVPMSDAARRWLPDVKDKRGLVYKGLPGKTRVSLILKEWAKKAGVNKNVTFETSHNTFAYLLLTTGTSLHTLAEMWNMHGIHRKKYLLRYAEMAGLQLDTLLL